MASKPILHVLLDTSYLCGVGFNDPDFRKLLQHAKASEIDIFVPHISWEERRTQLAESTITRAQALRDNLEELKRPWIGGLVSESIILPNINLWNDDEIISKSKEAMSHFAQENKIHIVGIGPDHAERAWERYFSVQIPFNRQEKKRELRRKDIPDSWIFEVAIDLYAAHGQLAALCRDMNLSDALKSIGVTVFEKTEQALNAISGAIFGAAAISVPNTNARQAVPAHAAGLPMKDALDEALSQADAPLHEVQKKVLGYVAHLGNPSKDELFRLMSLQGYRLDVARNAAERLALGGIIEDTGNHYLPKNKTASALASPFVEAEIIKLLEQ